MRKTGKFGEFKEAIALALDVLLRNPLRSFLTVLGIVIGVTTIIVIGAVINGLNSNVLGNIQQLGSSTVIISKYSWATLGRLSPEVLQRKDLQPEWVDALKQLPHVVAAAPAAQIENYAVGAGSSEVRRGNLRAKNVILEGDGPEISQISDFGMERGRFFNETDEEHHSSVTVLGHITANTLFPNGEDPDGQEVLLEGHDFTVIGVLEEQKQALGTGENPEDNTALVPFSVIRKLHPEFKNVIFLAKADTTENLPLVLDEVREYMRRVRKLPSDKDDDFAVLTTDTFLELWNQISSGIFIVMLAVGSVALLVGGIGVMNIMLVSVTERTREIGVRKAIGARQSNILTQFLLEAVTLAVLGGTIGVLLGSFIVLVIRLAFSSFPASVSFTLVAVGVTVASMIGIFFGVYPAWKAARLNPVEALRYE
ncbi:MAG TPA: ABC transporter permease [Candidatus Acidoferrales bacterium]|jgi:putative ABC transport system permease protein|nr:ABC transporter permease [Candidatus Acidoferrales bacterium]